MMRMVTTTIVRELLRVRVEAREKNSLEKFTNNIKKRMRTTILKIAMWVRDREKDKTGKKREEEPNRILIIRTRRMKKKISNKKS